SSAGLALPHDRAYRYKAIWSVLPDWETVLQRLTFEPGRETLIGRVLLEGQSVHIPDLAADPEYSLQESAAYFRTLLGMPLLRDNEPIGVLVLSRQQVEPFTERQCPASAPMRQIG